MRQDISRSYSDAEKEGFIHQNSNRTKKEKCEILNRYSYLTDQCLQKKSSYRNQVVSQQTEKQIIWSDQDKQNKQYAIEVVGYDPFEEYPEEGRKFFSISCRHISKMTLMQMMHINFHRYCRL